MRYLLLLEKRPIDAVFVYVLAHLAVAKGVLFFK